MSLENGMKKWLPGFVLLLAALAPLPAMAALQVDVTQGNASSRCPSPFPT